MVRHPAFDCCGCGHRTQVVVVEVVVAVALVVVVDSLNAQTVWRAIVFFEETRWTCSLLNRD